MKNINNSYRLSLTDEKNQGERLDKFIAFAIPELSRSRIQALIDEGHILLNAHSCAASYKMKQGDVIEIRIPEPIPAVPEAQSIPLTIVFEDEHLLVIDKAPGLVVHPAPGHPDETLVNALLAHCGGQLSGIGGVKRPGIVHRLDKETSGLMVVAKHDQAHQGLSMQFADHSLSRTYHALVWGGVQPRHGTIETFLNRCPKNRQKMAVRPDGKWAVTHYQLLDIFGLTVDIGARISLVECILETGRTHQIRVHMAYIGHPLVGDPVYGHAPKNASKICGHLLNRQALHAKKIAFTHPVTQEKMAFEVDYPTDIQILFRSLRM